MYQTLKVIFDPSGVLTIALNRPQVRNSFNEELVQELTQVFSKEALQPQTRAIVLRGEGPVFCAGGDLNWMKKSIQLNHEENLNNTRALAQMFATLNECTKPVIGAIHGAAIGGGVGLVSICDIVIATADTQFSLSEVKLGIVPACVGPFVISKIGASHARRLFISAQRFNAEEAKTIGLIHEVSTDLATLEIKLQEVIENILQCSPNAMSVAKKLVLDLGWPERRAQHPDCLEYVAKLLAELRVSPEGQEGIKAFLEKRTPYWFVKRK